MNIEADEDSSAESWNYRMGDKDDACSVPAGVCNDEEVTPQAPQAPQAPSNNMSYVQGKPSSPIPGHRKSSLYHTKALHLMISAPVRALRAYGCSILLPPGTEKSACSSSRGRTPRVNISRNIFVDTPPISSPIPPVSTDQASSLASNPQGRYPRPKPIH